MPNEFSPLQFRAPEVVDRRRMRSARVPVDPVLFAERERYARELSNKVGVISNQLRVLPPEARKAVFLKIEHDRKVDLGGTDLKLMAEQSSSISLAIPKASDLTKLENKINEFSRAAPTDNHLPNEGLVYFTKEIRLGIPTDRLSDQFLSVYQSAIDDQLYTYELELISFENGSRKVKIDLMGKLSLLERELGNGVHGHVFEHEYFSNLCRVILRSNGRKLKQLVEESNWQTTIAWFDEKPRFETFQAEYEDFNFGELQPIPNIDPDAPAVCMIDSGINTGNPFLRNVSNPEWNKSFLDSKLNDPSDEHGHGSGVASLISYYSLNIANGAVNIPRIFVASARLHDQDNQGDEKLLSKKLKEIVSFYAPLGIKVFNLSVGIINRSWNLENRRTLPRRSWIARTLDELSYQHDVVFVVSAGNIPLPHIGSLIGENGEYPNYLFSPDSRLLDPAQSAGAITVGSINSHTLIHTSPQSIVLGNTHEPSGFTRTGPGVLREAKPDVVEFGGGVVFDQSLGRVRRNSAQDVVMASKNLTPALARDVGTSFATARVSHKIANIQNELRLLNITPSLNLLKALLVNTCESKFFSSEEFSRELSINALGYGVPDHLRATETNAHSCLLYFDGEIETDKVSIFKIPVPRALSESTGRKRLTITVSYLPEVHRNALHRYMGTKLEWDLFRGDTEYSEVLDFYSEREESVEEQEVNEEDNPKKLTGFTYGKRARSKGLVQHDIIEWTRHTEEHSNGDYVLALLFRSLWASKQKPVKYSVVVRLEDDGRAVQIYDLVRASVTTPVRLSAN